MEPTRPTAGDECSPGGSLPDVPSLTAFVAGKGEKLMPMVYCQINKPRTALGSRRGRLGRSPGGGLVGHLHHEACLVAFHFDRDSGVLIALQELVVHHLHK